MPKLPALDRSLLVRTEFSDDPAWARVTEEAQRVNEDGFRAYIEPISDPSFDGAGWEAVKAAIPSTSGGPAVLFVADDVALASPDHPILVVDLVAGRAPFRSIPSELWSIDNNLNIANMDWEEFAHRVDEDGVLRGFNG